MATCELVPSTCQCWKSPGSASAVAEVARASWWRFWTAVGDFLNFFFWQRKRFPNLQILLFGWVFFAGIFLMCFSKKPSNFEPTCQGAAGRGTLAFPLSKIFGVLDIHIMVYFEWFFWSTILFTRINDPCLFFFFSVCCSTGWAGPRIASMELEGNWKHWTQPWGVGAPRHSRLFFAQDDGPHSHGFTSIMSFFPGHVWSSINLVVIKRTRENRPRGLHLPATFFRGETVKRWNLWDDDKLRSRRKIMKVVRQGHGAL